MGSTTSSSVPSSRAPNLPFLVFAGGDPPTAGALRDVPPSTLVVAADSGVEHALALGIHVDLVVGDLDSASAAAVDAALAGGAEVERHPVDKDATDLELALRAARDRGGTDVLVVGIHGGRYDHFLANTLLLAAPSFEAMRVRAWLGDTEVVVVRDHAELHGQPGELCSLLPLGGAASGVTTTNLRFPLDGETLQPGTTRGVSNEFLASSASVSLTDGVLLAVLPHTPNSTPNSEQDA